VSAGPRAELIRAIHASPARGVFVVAGGGALLLSDLLTVPGASATVLEARVPYHRYALAEFIGGEPDQAASAETACTTAMAAFERARELAGNDDTPLFGLAITASLATTTPKRGGHRVHVALQTGSETRVSSIPFDKDARSRVEEEEVCRDLALYALADLLDLTTAISPALVRHERIDGHRMTAPSSWQALLAGTVIAVPHPDQTPWPRALLPGAFNPLHDGHRKMATYASERLGVPVAYELCVRNVDKPSLHFLAIQHRLAQFNTDAPVWLTRAPTFVEKARHFPGVQFVVGIDTLARIAEPRYYGSDRDARDQAISEMRELGVGFLVFGRRIGERFSTLEDLDIPGALQALCTGVDEKDFRNDLSSTAIRTAALPSREDADST